MYYPCIPCHQDRENIVIGLKLIELTKSKDTRKVFKY